MFRHPESYKEGSGKEHLCFSVEFSKYIFERSHFTILKVMSFFEIEHQIHQMFCKLVNIWLPGPYLKSPNTQMDTQNIMNINIL